MVSIHMRFPMYAYQSERSSWEKYNKNVITSLIWSFFQMAISFSHMLQLFQNNFNFGEATISTQEQLLFLRNSFFRTLTYLQQLFFQNSCFFQQETSTEHPLFENRKFFKAVTCWNSYLFGRGFVQNKDNYKTCLQVLLRRINFFLCICYCSKSHHRQSLFNQLASYTKHC